MLHEVPYRKSAVFQFPRWRPVPLPSLLRVRHCCKKCCLRWKECTQNGLLNSSCVVSGMGSYFFDLLQRTLLKRQCKLCEDYEARLHFVFVHKISFCICLCVRTILQTNMRFELFSAWTEKALNPNPTSQLYAYVISLLQA